MLRVAAGLAALIASLSFQPATAAGAFPDWLAGTWAMERGAAWADEVWTGPRGEIMLGVAREGFGPKAERWQSARIVRGADGMLRYIYRVQGGAEVELTEQVASGQAIEFAGAGGSFPQRVRFAREGQLLMIALSQLDGSEAVERNYRPVETAPKD